MTAPLLIFAWGNPGRGDDALGPLLLERLAAVLPSRPEWRGVELLTDFQPQPEHALDLEGRRRVLFVDASASCPPPFTFSRVEPAAESGYTTHAMSPAALLAAYRQVTGRVPPPAWLLAVRGASFGLGEPLSGAARAHLEAARAFLFTWLGQWQTGV